ncbi:sulfite exporter TauE/SafE family protein [Cytobacillus praedii]|uniref:Sulfite exporter TauE/SafE family protein n=1 Tax=Cytobacillus praedii TaxID=1742358 RepID=A0A4R1AW18_9BACI|nr:sulfite exporter TauE/SafE family protein [Cytobacillus praedii]TCJ02030.1 sulfite exporter TauE/SafE family protein [Cytobacillus praedii]
MYQLLNDLSQALSGPFLSMVDESKEIPLLGAFILGLVGALAPCQLTGNMGAITFYGNKSIQTNNHWVEAFFFIIGKITVFSALGFFVWLLGQELQMMLPEYFSIFRKLMGPLFIIMGLVLIGVIQLKWVSRVSGKLPAFKGNGKMGSFLMGAIFSISFCPTMFSLFFFGLMPLVLNSTYGAVLPPIFAIGTSVPLIVFLMIIYVLGMDGSLMRKSRKIGQFIQRIAGLILLLIGIMDTITYWA